MLLFFTWLSEQLICVWSTNHRPLVSHLYVPGWIYEHPWINAIAPLDQFQWIQISLELTQWLVMTMSIMVTVHNCSPQTVHTIRCSQLFTIWYLGYRDAHTLLKSSEVADKMGQATSLNGVWVKHTTSLCECWKKRIWPSTCWLQLQIDFMKQH